jgi:hypothetical protein
VPAERANHQSGGEEIAGELVISRSNAPPIFGAAEEVLYFVALAIETPGAVSFLGGIAAARDDRQSAFVFDLLMRLLRR